MYCKNPEENDEKNHQDEAVIECVHEASILRRPLSFEQEGSFPFEEPARLTLPPLPSNNAGISARAATRDAQWRLSDHAQASNSHLPSRTAVTMQSTLLQRGALLESKSSRIEMITITSEERDTVRSQEGFLPPIPRGPNTT